MSNTITKVNDFIQAPLNLDTNPTRESGPSEGRVINVPIIKHSLSLGLLFDTLIAKLCRFPIRFFLTLAYYLVHSQFYLRSRHKVKRKSFTIPSRERGRRIKVDAYVPIHLIGSTRPTPVHMNWHGSGFVLDCFGADGELCGILAQKMDCIVLDADYRKAPEHPFPSGIQDAEDLVNFVIQNNQIKSLQNWIPRFDLHNLSVGGSSAGGNLALVMGVIFGGKRIRAVTVIAPPTDFRPISRPKVALEKNHPRAIPLSIATYFDRCYLIKSANRDDPTLSPICSEMKKGQLDCDLVYIAVGKGDTLYHDGLHLIQSLQNQGHKNAIFSAIPGEGHGFEKSIGIGESKKKALATFDEIAHLIRNSWQIDKVNATSHL